METMAYHNKTSTSYSLKCYKCTQKLTISSPNFSVLSSFYVTLGVNVHLRQSPLTGNRDRFEVYCFQCFDKYDKIEKQDLQRVSQLRCFQSDLKNRQVRLAQTYVQMKQRLQSKYQSWQHMLQFQTNSFLEQMSALSVDLENYIVKMERYSDWNNFDNNLKEIQKEENYVDEFNLSEEDVSIGDYFQGYSEYQISTQKVDKNKQNDQEEQQPLSYLFHDSKIQVLSQNDNPFQSLLDNLFNGYKDHLSKQISRLQQQFSNDLISFSQKQSEIIKSHEDKSNIQLISCSSCKNTIFLNQVNLSKISQSHLQINLDAYLLNSTPKSHFKKDRNDVNTFEIFCYNCYLPYCKAIRIKYQISQPREVIITKTETLFKVKQKNELICDDDVETCKKMNQEDQESNPSKDIDYNPYAQIDSPLGKKRGRLPKRLQLNNLPPPPPLNLGKSQKQVKQKSQTNQKISIVPKFRTMTFC